MYILIPGLICLIIIIVITIVIFKKVHESRKRTVTYCRGERSGQINSKEEGRACNLVPDKFRSVLKIVTLYIYIYTTKGLYNHVVTKFSNILLPLLNFAVNIVYYWCYMPSSP